MTYNVVVVGGGAAGFFAAINAAMHQPNYRILLLEKSPKVLQKVRISGGGRCNVTNQISEPTLLKNNYPRGNEVLQQAFERFSSKDTVAWFKQQGVTLKTEKDGRVFPTTDTSQTIIDCFLGLCARFKIEVITGCEVSEFTKQGDTWRINTVKGATYMAKNVVITTGSSPAFWNKLAKKDVNIVPPVPSLFTFTLDSTDITNLSGVSVPMATVTIATIGLQQSGPLLITHWGFSGPAILRLSSAAALRLHAEAYNVKITVNWLSKSVAEVISELKSFASANQKKTVYGSNPTELPNRLWKYQLEKHAFGEFQNWAETGKKHYSILAGFICNDVYQVSGKSTFKDEFVTAGGINLSEINQQTFSHREDETLFFAGEVLNIDAFTGGFNFQAAWTTGWIVARSLK